MFAQLSCTIRPTPTLFTAVTLFLHCFKTVKIQKKRQQLLNVILHIWQKINIYLNDNCLTCTPQIQTDQTDHEFYYNLVTVSVA